MAFYLQNPNTGEKVPFTSTSGIDYQMYLKSGYVPVSGGTTSTSAPTPSAVSAPTTQTQYTQPATYANQGIDLSKYGISRNEFGSITTAPTAALLDDYENIRPITGTGPGGSMITIGYTGTPIPKTTVIDPNTGNRVVVRTDSSSSRFPNINDLQSRGYVTEKAPGIASTGQTFGGAADLSQNPDIRLASGEIISRTNPNYSYYANIPGSTKIPSSATSSAAGTNIGNEFYLQNPNTGEKVPFASTSGVDYQMYLKSGYVPVSGGIANTNQNINTYNGIDMNGWSDSQKSIFPFLEEILQKQSSYGKVLNPNLVLDDATVARFKEQAATELAPQQRQVLNQAIQDTDIAMGRIQSRYEKDRRQLELQYGKNLEGTQESYARRGLAFSSERNKAEQDLATSAQQSLKDVEEAARQQAEDVGLKSERYLGSSNFPKTSYDISTGSRPLTGIAGGYGFTSPTESKALFTPFGGTTGTYETGKAEEIGSYAENLMKRNLSWKGEEMKNY